MFTRYFLAGILSVLSQAQWAHAGPSNDGFTDVVTAPAASPSIAFNTLPGTFAPGVAPVFGKGGLLLIGNEQGTLSAWRPDATEVWAHQLPNEQGIKASVVVGADGSIYVVGVTGRKSPQVTITGQQATLYKFDAGGGLVWQHDFPAVYQQNGYTTAPPNIWSSGGVEVIMVPAFYRTPVGNAVSVHLDAFSSTDGALLADAVVTNTPPTITGDWPGILGYGQPFGYSEPCFPSPNSLPSLPSPPLPPLPGVAVSADPAGGAPWVIVSDGRQDVVGYSFNLPGQFIERFRAHDTARIAASGPMVLPDGHSVTGAYDGDNLGRITFSAPNGAKLKDVKVPGGILGTPSRTANGEIVAVGYTPHCPFLSGFVTMLNSDGVLHRFSITGLTRASAAVSRNHIFVATATALATLDAGTLNPIRLFDWKFDGKGGQWPPAIGPDGRVYAMDLELVSTPTNNVLVAHNRIWVFPPPPKCVACGIGGVQNGGSIGIGGAKSGGLIGVQSGGSIATP